MLLEFIGLNSGDHAEMAFVERVIAAQESPTVQVINQERESKMAHSHAITAGYGEGAARLAQWIPLGFHRTPLNELSGNADENLVTINHSMTLMLQNKEVSEPIFSIVPFEACCGSAFPDLCILVGQEAADVSILESLNRSVYSITRENAADPEFDISDIARMIDPDYVAENSRETSVMDDFAENFIRMAYLDSKTGDVMFYDHMRMPNGNVEVTRLDPEKYEEKDTIDISELEVGDIVTVSPPGETSARVIARVEAITPVDDLMSPEVTIETHQDVSGVLIAKNSAGVDVAPLVKQGDTIIDAESGQDLAIHDLLNLSGPKEIYLPTSDSKLTVTGLKARLPASSKTEIFAQLSVDLGFRKVVYTQKLKDGFEIEAVSGFNQWTVEVDAGADTAGTLVEGLDLLTSDCKKLLSKVWAINPKTDELELFEVSEDESFMHTTHVDSVIRSVGKDKLTVAYRMSDAVDRVGEVAADTLTVTIADKEHPEIMIYTQMSAIEPGDIIYNADGKGTHSYYSVTEIG